MESTINGAIDPSSWLNFKVAIFTPSEVVPGLEMPSQMSGFSIFLF